VHGAGVPQPLQAARAQAHARGVDPAAGQRVVDERVAAVRLRHARHALAHLAHRAVGRRRGEGLHDRAQVGVAVQRAGGGQAPDARAAVGKVVQLLPGRAVTALGLGLEGRPYATCRGALARGARLHAPVPQELATSGHAAISTPRPLPTMRSTVAHGEDTFCREAALARSDRRRHSSRQLAVLGLPGSGCRLRICRSRPGCAAGR